MNATVQPIRSAPAPAVPADLADLQQLNIKAVCAIVGRSPTTVHDLVRAGLFPKPLRDGSRCTRWTSGQIKAWLIEQQAKAAQIDEAPMLARAVKASQAAAAKRASGKVAPQPADAVTSTSQTKRIEAQAAPPPADSMPKPRRSWAQTAAAARGVA